MSQKPQPGELVSIIADGPFKGMEGSVVSVQDAAETAKLEVFIHNRPVSVVVAFNEIEMAR